MIYALNPDNNRIIARPKIKGICPICKGECIAKCGNIKIWHFAHKNKLECDSYSEPESYWHLNWKEKFPESMREIVIEKNGIKHVADIENNGIVLELQHSSISEPDIKARERFYGNMIWLFDLTEKYDNDQFFVSTTDEHLEIDDKGKCSITYTKRDYATFLIKWGRKLYTKCDSRIFLDYGKHLFEIKKIYPYGKRGWGYIRDYDYLVDLIKNNPYKERKAEKMDIKIAILNVEKIDNGKSTIGRIDFKLNSTEFYGWKVIKSDKGTFIAPPSEKVGETYRPLIKFPQDLMKIVSEQLLQSWKDNHQ